MPAKPKTPPASAIRLGEIIRRERLRRDVPALHLAKRAGVGRSYISYLESGGFQQVRVDKLLRILQVLELDIEAILEEAGYLPKKVRSLPEPAAYLRQRYRLSESSIQQALSFLDYLISREKPKR
jgi:transcriptional regulator with XRE-family HTH domain